MKNIYVLPTDKPSRIHVDFGSTFLTPNYQIGKEINSVVDSINIYITSDEEIKEDYVIAYGVVIKVMIFDKETLYFVNGTKAKREDCKKIILTTDQDLIKDGVQAIDDEFLEWFVKNPSCEEVETEIVEYGFDEVPICIYKISIPKEEPKQETLEEASKKYAKGLDKYSSDDFINGARWQQKRMYSEEDMKKAFQDGKDNIDYSETYGWSSKLTTEDWFEQFKKK